MNTPDATPSAIADFTRGRAAVAALILVGLALIAYHNSFSGPFVFDDEPAIKGNPTIRDLSALGEVLSPPRQMTVSGRPVINLSLAVNYALSGLSVGSYHVVNFLIHVLAGLTLFGLVRRTLDQPGWRERFGEAAPVLALAIAVLWTVHPLQTESVTYVVQRAESLMGLFYFLTLYCFIRATTSTAPGAWYAGAVGACLLGMASKEVMVTAPLMVLLYDRTFLAGTFRGAWAKRGRWYLGLAATWLLLAYLVTSAGGNRAGAKGFGINAEAWNYWLCQFRAVVHYLWLSVWPGPLVFEYGIEKAGSAGEIAVFALIVAALLAGTFFALWRRMGVGFLSAWFFGILALTSVVPGTSQMTVEHRMYLPLAAVVSALVLGLYAWLGRRSLLVCLAAALALCGLTIARNEDYRDDVALWQDTVAKRPDNARAQFNLGYVLSNKGRLAEAKPHYAASARLRPESPETAYALGHTLFQLGQVDEAIGEYERALRLKPDYHEVHNDLGAALADRGRMEPALAHLREALRIKPDYPEAHNNLGLALVQMNRMDDALAEYNAALRAKPDYAEAYNNLGTALGRMNRLAEAKECFEKAVRLSPDFAEAHSNLGMALVYLGRPQEAVAQFQRALEIDPVNPQTRANLDALLRELQAGRR